MADKRRRRLRQKHFNSKERRKVDTDAQFCFYLKDSLADQIFIFISKSKITEEKNNFCFRHCR